MTTDAQPDASPPAGRCPLCDGPIAAMFPDAAAWLARCGHCGLGMAHPQPSDDELAAIYNAEYYSQFGYRQGNAAFEQALGKIKSQTYDRMLALAERHVRPGRLLDVGCALGYSLLAARRRGWDCFGLEPHAMAGRGLPAELAERIVRGTLDACPPGRPFTLVSLIDVIEHVRDPLATLRQASGLLADDGLLLLATNDLRSRPARRLGPRWVHFHKAHLWYFDAETLAAAARAAGLEVLHAGPARRVYNLQYVASILADGDNFPLARRLARLSLRCVPWPLRLMRWPALTEGIVLIARRPGR